MSPPFYPKERKPRDTLKVKENAIGEEAMGFFFLSQAPP